MAATAFRVAAAHNQLWLDEVISWHIARHAGSLFAVFTTPIDNNHWLNTAWMYLAGDRDGALVYRAPSILAGVTAVAAFGLAARPHGRPHALLAMTLAAFSYPLIHYSSEARGYSMAVMFALLCAFALREAITRKSRRHAAAAGVFAALGILSHLCFLHFWIAGLAWTFLRVRRERWSAVESVRALALCHGPPVLTLVTLGWLDLRRMIFLGASPVVPTLVVARKTLALFAGTSGSAAVEFVAGAFFLCLLAIALRERWRRDPADALLLGLPCLAAPLITVVASHGQPLFVRYFIVGGAFALLAIAIWLGDLWTAGHRRVAGALAGVLSFGGLLLATDLIARGRGEYVETVRFLDMNTTADRIAYEPSQEFQAEQMLDYYRRFAAKPFVPADPDPEWYLASDFTGEPAPATVTDAAGRTFELVAIFGEPSMSSFAWRVYRRATASPGER